ncbi:hypothetical protein O181_005074 [Austropuccinia psidii MF-1]|uniref:GAG-pre-integrase domain-containing protein n=1 Tax=Austropuccinia psidii MF-1 TaxID=1389203 RepID=A0A9Q3BGW3_9BASI|nr:hypothetical protein [Austropuccinia psidii MF-1]
MLRYRSYLVVSNKPAHCYLKAFPHLLAPSFLAVASNIPAPSTHSRNAPSKDGNKPSNSEDLVTLVNSLTQRVDSLTSACARDWAKLQTYHSQPPLVPFTSSFPTVAGIEMNPIAFPSSTKLLAKAWHARLGHPNGHTLWEFLKAWVSSFNLKT